MNREPGLRERKKQRTQHALVEAAMRLFLEQGYQQTTLAQIAEAADISTRTFFSYFASKEDVVFFDNDATLRQALEVIDDRQPGETVSELVLRAVARVMNEPESQVTTELGKTRDTLVLNEPALQTRELRLMFNCQRELAHALHRSYPDELGFVEAMSAIGAVVGAQYMAIVASQELGRSRHELMSDVHYATDLALQGVNTLTTRSRDPEPEPKPEREPQPR